MNVKEICKNCEHGKPAPEKEFPSYRNCLVWNKEMHELKTCQHFQIKESLLPSLEDIQKIYALYPSPQ